VVKVASGTLLCGLTPTGRIDVHPGPPDEGPGLSTAAQRRIIDAFNAGRGHGVLHLGAAELSTDLHPTLSYWRDIGRSFVARVCGALDPTDPTSLVIPASEPDEIAAFSEAVPPMPGAELLTPALLDDLWSDIGTALTSEVARFKGGEVQGYLQTQSSVWNVVGRVCLHLAENRRDRDYPFAFITTYVHKVSKQATPQHLPLGQALRDYAGANNRQKLLALLAPLSRAAEQSDVIRELVECGDIYHPLSWTPREAHRFLCEVELYERAGLVVRMPDWWSATRRPRPKVSVSVGDTAPATLGMSALLNFDVTLTLDGKSMSPKDIDAVLASTEGLVLIKGKWVEVDREKLGEVLDQWRDLQKQAKAGFEFFFSEFMIV
jgi:non-specific serine/threonine protein kinase